MKNLFRFILFFVFALSVLSCSNKSDSKKNSKDEAAVKDNAKNNPAESPTINPSDSIAPLEETVCLNSLEETVRHCKNENLNGIYYNMGYFYEQCMVNTTTDNIQERIQNHAQWIKRSIIPGCNKYLPISRSTSCIAKLEDAVRHCRNGYLEGVYLNLGWFYETCVTYDEYTLHNIIERTKTHTHWIERSVIPECNILKERARKKIERQKEQYKKNKALRQTASNPPN